VIKCQELAAELHLEFEDLNSTKGNRMKHSKTISLSVTLSLLLLLLGSPLTAQAAPPRFRADSGVITLGANQVLRITINPASLPNGNVSIRARLRWMQYGEVGCSGMPLVCRHTIVSQGETGIVMLDRDDTVLFEVLGGAGPVRAVVEANNPNLTAMAVVFDTSTQRVISMVIMANTEGD